MTILVLGHLVLDEIHSYDGNVYHGPGGITFPVTAFGALTGDGDTLLPLFPYGRDASDILHALEADCPSADFRHCWVVEEENTRVRLFHESASQYNTQLVRSLGSIPHERIAPVLGQADLVYLNMMTGHDITLETAAQLRGAGRLVYIDLHMIAYRVHADGRREPAPSDRWREWLRAGDVLQCNEREFAALIPGAHSDEERLSMLFDAAAPRCFVLTRGESGADIYHTASHPHHVPAMLPGRTVDPTGCGDAFGSTFAVGLARGEAVEDAARRAARAAAFVAGIPGSQGMTGLRAFLEGEAA
jgi:sugar/nucleoside kinase (ribokinase family)